MKDEKKMKNKSEFRVLIVYPNLPLMLVPSIAVGLFTSILREQGYTIDLFETTHYLSEDVSSSDKRTEMLNWRKFDAEEDLGIKIKDDMFGDFRRKVKTFKPDFMVFSVVEDAFLQSVKLLQKVQDLEIPHLIGECSLHLHLTNVLNTQR